MRATAMHAELANVSADFGMRVFGSMKLRRLVGRVVSESGAKQQRLRALRPSLVVCLVVAMALYRDRGIPRVFSELIRWMRGQPKSRGRRSKLSTKSVSGNALIKARKRLGVMPLALLFERLATGIRPKATFHGLVTWSVDGVRLDMPDTKANTRRFKKWKASKGSPTAFPRMLAVVLLATETRQVRDVALGHCFLAERDCCADFLKHLDCRDLVFLDRGFHAVWLFKRFLDKRVHFLCRASSSYKPSLLKKLGKGDHLVAVCGRIPLPPSQRRRNGPKTELITLELRMIESHIGSKTVRLLTDLKDPVKYPARELAEAYHKRWEAEISNDELETHLANVGGGAPQLTLRSKIPDCALQEAYGLFIAYNLVRSLILEAAQKHSIPAQEISFVESLDVIRRAAPDFETANKPVRRFLVARLLQDLADCRLERTRRPRQVPRAVRIKIKHFPRKRPAFRERAFDALAKLKMGPATTDRRKAA